MTAGYDTLIVTFSDPICVLDRMFLPCMGSGKSEGMDRRLRKHTHDPDKRPYGSHHFRIQYGARGGMAQKAYLHCGDERILSAWRWKHRPLAHEVKTHKTERA